MDGNATEYAAGKKYNLLVERHGGRRRIGEPTFEECAEIVAALGDARSALMASGCKTWPVFRRIVERDRFTLGTAETMRLKEASKALIALRRMEG